MLKGIKSIIRDTVFQIARKDLALFLEEHEDDILRIFKEEIKRMDDQIPEERYFIDIKMVPLGEMILKASLEAIRRFLTENPPTDVDENDEIINAGED